MTTTQRKIRDVVASRIQAALPAAHFFRSPHRDLAEAELPAVCLWGITDRPSAGDEDDHQGPHERVYTVRTEILAAGRGDDDATDDLAVEVRRAVLADDTLGGLVNRTTWAEQTWDGSEGEFPLSGTLLNFNVFYLWRPE